RYDLKSIHQHTPAEYTVDDGTPYPMEFHLVHKSAAGQIAVVGVLVESGKADKGIIEPPSSAEPYTVDIDPRDLLPADRSYWRFNGSLTTPTASGVPSPPDCAEGVLWTEMREPIELSPDQIAAFKDSNNAVWGTTNIARPVQPANGRFILIPASAGANSDR
ncbi:MAG TPA: carbonic anhydrase family protein, partial [Candidatus Binataceae bacterium]|nr:carbonic anhydrase family protein [Candidatus Binataceae bacterium]